MKGQSKKTETTKLGIFIKHSYLSINDFARHVDGHFRETIFMGPFNRVNDFLYCWIKGSKPSKRRITEWHLLEQFMKEAWAIELDYSWVERFVPQEEEEEQVQQDEIKFPDANTMLEYEERICKLETNAKMNRKLIQGLFTAMLCDGQDRDFLIRTMLNNYLK